MSSPVRPKWALVWFIVTLTFVFSCSDERGFNSGDESDAGSDNSGVDLGTTGCTAHADCPDGQFCELELGCAAGTCADHLEPVIEPGTMYEEWESWPCLVDSCNCAPSSDRLWHGVMKCDAIHSGFFWTFGSAELRVMGRDESGQCVIEISEVLEGGVRQQTCRLDFPIEPWPGLSGDYSQMSPFLDGFPGECDEPTNCCTLDGCPNPCDDEEVESMVCFRFPLHQTPCE